MVGKSRRPYPRQIHFATATLVLMAAASAQAGLAPATPGEAMPAEIKIVSTEFKYSPARVLVPAGRAVTVVLDNSGAETEHVFVVPALGFRLQAKAGEIAKKAFVFNRLGAYEFNCDLPAHREAGMTGKLIVGPVRQ